MNLTDVLPNNEYRELYPIEERNMSVLIHEPTQKIYLCKQRKNYDIRVYEYLKDHPHPNISSIHLYFEKDDTLIVLEEYIEGKSLKELLRNPCPSINISLPDDDSLKHNSYGNTKSDHNASEVNYISDKEKIKNDRGNNLLPDNDPAETKRRIQILDAVCDGLSFLHHADPPIIHRDLKASNIILTKDGEIKLIDYDAAKIYKEKHSEDTVHIGTPGIAAPEQYGFAQSDARTDIYALGKLTEQLFGTDPRYAKLIEKATEIDPRNRYQNVEEFKAALHGTPILARSGKIKRYIPMIFLLLLIPVAWFLGRGSRGKLDNSIPENTQTANEYISDNNLGHGISDNDPAEETDLIAATAPDDNNPRGSQDDQTMETGSADNESSDDDTNNSEVSDDETDRSGQTENDATGDSEQNGNDGSEQHSNDDDNISNSESNENNDSQNDNENTNGFSNGNNTGNNYPANTDQMGNGSQSDGWNASILTPEDVAAISVPTNSTFQYWGINFSIPYYYTTQQDTLIGHAFSGVRVGSLSFVTKQDYFAGGYHTLSQEEIQQVAFDWTEGHKNYTVTSSSSISLAGYSGTLIHITHTMESGRVDYINVVVFYDELNGTTRVIRQIRDQNYTDYPFNSDLETMIQNASRY